MKRCLTLLLAFVLLFGFTACNNTSDIGSGEDNDTTTTNHQGAFTSIPYAEIDEANAEEEFAQLDWVTILEQIPTDRYELYPGQNGAPTTATLYKDGESVSIDVYDPRLVRMMNFYNNIVYHLKHAYTQGLYPHEEYDKLASSDFRLVLIYENDNPDKQIVTGNAFVDVHSNNIDVYAAPAMGRFPLYAHRTTMVWLTLFGF